ncbi:unnamed protein product [Pieris macdunnoughi]|uniref:Caspase family p20 domain-containing protein n=1 Tax=Pieris macdunnoughi TaxID=345717 RepID=A0A821TIK1_9NEOP|nr:unnamed protein product [Pieris macdunnoughi]
MSTSTNITFAAGRKICECTMCQLKKELEDNDRSTTDGTVYNLPEYEANVTPSAKQKPIQRVSIVFKSNQKPSVNTKVTSEANPQSPNSSKTVNSPKISESKVTEPKTVLATNLPLENQTPSDVTKVTPEANPQSPNSSNTVNSPKISESKVTESTNVLPRAVNQKEQPTKNVILPSRKCSQPKIINIKEDRTNTRPLNKYAKTYELEKFEKKLLIIINQYEIIGYKEPRWGTEKDVSALTNTFPKFGFQIELHEEKTVSEVSTLLGTCKSDLIALLIDSHP